MAYGKPSREAVESAQVGGGAEFWNPADGENRIRVMPPWSEDAGEFWFITATHFNVGPDERPVPCPVASGIRESCYVCRLVKKLARGEDDEKSDAEAMGARPRYLLNIVDLGNPQNGVQVWPAPKSIFRQLKKFWLNEEDYGDFTSLVDGFDILVEKTGSGLNTRYDANPTKPKKFPSETLLNHRNASVAELYQALADEEYELPNLSQVQSFISDEEMERVFKGLSSGRARTEKASDNGNGDGEEPEEKPRTTRRPVPAEEPEEGEEPEEEPEEKPERTKKPRPTSTRDEPEGRSRIRGRMKELD